MKIALAYNEEDAKLIKKLETDLSNSGYSFVHFDFSRSKPEYLLYEALADYQWPILFFISSKFLKSATSMTGMLSFFQEKEEQIYPILVPETAGDVSTIPDIERVGGIIKYINYWQEHYLDLRRQKKELKLADEDSFNAHLKRIREISTEIGEFLRQLRASTYCSVPEFEANDFEVFFEFIDDSSAWEQFKRTRGVEKAPLPEKESKEKSDKELVEAELSSIPGISLLPKEEKKEEENKISSTKKAPPSVSEQEQTPDPVPAEEVNIPDVNAEITQDIVVEKEAQSAPAVEVEKDTPKAVKMSMKKKTDSMPSTDAQTALEALKDNINRLSELLKEKEEAAKNTKKSRPGNGKTVLITGGTSGIGKATAAIFAKNGFNVIITGRRKDKIDSVSQKFSEKYDTSVNGIAFDVCNKKEVEKALKSLGKGLEKIDILINNAGKAKGFDPIHEGNFEHWEEMIDTNIKGLLYMTRLVSPQMVERQSGHIINVGSIAGKETYPNGNVYCATKFAVDGLTKAMRIDLHTHNVRVSQISPAHVEETEFALVRFDGDEKKAKIYEDFTPLNARDIAESIYFIATQPAHVNILDIVLQGTQQPSATILDKSGRK